MRSIYELFLHSQVTRRIAKCGYGKSEWQVYLSGALFCVKQWGQFCTCNLLLFLHKIMRGMVNMANCFDKTLDVNYGITYGRNKLVFIKAGRGGTIYGLDNKYVNIADRISKEYGYTVVISANHKDSVYVLEDELKLVKAMVPDYTEIIFVGMSAGALIGAQQGYLNEEIKSMLLINGPLMINWPKTKRGIEKFEGKIVEMLYGTKDPSYKYYEILKCINSDKLIAREIEGADHNFIGMQDVFEEEIIQFVGK